MGNNSLEGLSFSSILSKYSGFKFLYGVALHESPLAYKNKVYVFSLTVLISPKSTRAFHQICPPEKYQSLFHSKVHVFPILPLWFLLPADLNIQQTNTSTQTLRWLPIFITEQIRSLFLGSVSYIFIAWTEYSENIIQMPMVRFPKLSSLHLKCFTTTPSKKLYCSHCHRYLGLHISTRMAH